VDDIDPRRYYTVWIMVESSEDESDKTWWSVDHVPVKDEALELAEQIAETIEARTGVRPERLEQ
jgi:hypothetical protein